MEGQELIPKTPANATASLKRRLLASGGFESFPWTELEGERHLATCGHDV